MRRLLAVLVSVLAVGAVVGVTVSAFSDEASNSGNSFEAASSFGGQLQMASGSYTGDGSDNRSINAGFQPDVVIVKGNAAQTAVLRSSTMAGDNAKPLTGLTGLTSDLIESLGADGFSVGTDPRVNASGTTYYWQAFKGDGATLKVGSYTGDGAASRAISGAGFSPEFAAVLPSTSRRANQRYSEMSRGFQFDADAGSTTRITSLDADGFTVGDSDEANAANTTYHYVLFNEAAGSVKKGSYVGTGVRRSITGVGFTPLYVMIRADDTISGRHGQHRSAAVPGEESLFFNASTNGTNAITALDADGFSLGPNGSVNADGPTYHYLAFKDSGGG